MVSNVERDQIGAIPLFAGVEADYLAEISSHASKVTLGAHELLFADEDAADSLFIVLEGDVEVFVMGGQDCERVLAHIGAGMVLGEIPLLIGGRRSASARAAEPSVLLRIPYQELRELIQTDSPSAYRVVYTLAQVLATRLRSADDLLEELCKNDAAASASIDDIDRLRRIFFVDWGSR
jgi:CRP-like cAMP-binding protein